MCFQNNDYLCRKIVNQKIMLNIDNFYKARYVLSKIIRRTDLVHAPKINPECDVYLKPECLQKTGSFKIRGAYYKISQLSEEEQKKGVIACSAGNHAQGVALGATSMGIKSLICLPEGAPISKVEATKKLGAEVCLVPGVYDDAFQKPCNCAMSTATPLFTPSMMRTSLPDREPSVSSCLTNCPTWKLWWCLWVAAD